MKKRKTALVLGGGGSRGAYEAGVWQALKDLGIKIDIVTGTSVGAINAAMIAQHDMDHTLQLWKEMETDNIFDVAKDSQPIDYVRELVVNGGAGSSGLQALLEKYIDEEKVLNSDIEFGITAVSVPDLALHKMFKENIPKGKLRDYILASASAFPAVHSHNIDGVDYIDGGYRDVLPTDMALEKKPTHVIAVNLRGYGFVDMDSVNKAPNLVWIECPWDLGLQFVFNTDHSRKLLQLGYLDTMKAYNVMDGKYYAFAKGTFDSNTTKMADRCAKIFGMDPTVVYTKDLFLERLYEAVNESGGELQKVVKAYAGNSPKSFTEAGARLEEFNRLLKHAGNLKNVSEDLKQVKADKFITFAIANNMKEKGADSIYLTRGAMALFRDQVQAARFLIKYEIL